MSMAVRADLLAAVQRAAADAAVQAVVVIGAHERFIPGADIKEFGKPITGPSGRDVIAAIEGAGKPVVAALAGNALGGGLEIALGCHWRVATPDCQARPARGEHRAAARRRRHAAPDSTDRRCRGARHDHHRQADRRPQGTRARCRRRSDRRRPARRRPCLRAPRARRSATAAQGQRTQRSHHRHRHRAVRDRRARRARRNGKACSRRSASSIASRPRARAPSPMPTRSSLPRTRNARRARSAPR